MRLREPGFSLTGVAIVSIANELVAENAFGYHHWQPVISLPLWLLLSYECRSLHSEAIWLPSGHVAA